MKTTITSTVLLAMLVGGATANASIQFSSGSLSRINFTPSTTTTPADINFSTTTTSGLTYEFVVYNVNDTTGTRTAIGTASFSSGLSYSGVTGSGDNYTATPASASETLAIKDLGGAHATTLYSVSFSDLSSYKSSGTLDATLTKLSGTSSVSALNALGNADLSLTWTSPVLSGTTYQSLSYLNTHSGKFSYSGTITAVPEPGTVVAGSLALGLMFIISGWSLHRRKQDVLHVNGAGENTSI